LGSKTKSKIVQRLHLFPANFPSHFDESESSQSHKPFESESSEGHLKFFRVESKTSHDLLESGQSRVTRIVESLRVIGLQARVNVDSNEI